MARIGSSQPKKHEENTGPDEVRAHSDIRDSGLRGDVLLEKQSAQGNFKASAFIQNDYDGTAQLVRGLGSVSDFTDSIIILHSSYTDEGLGSSWLCSVLLEC